MSTPRPEDAAHVLLSTVNVQEIGVLRQVLPAMRATPHFCTDAGDVLRMSVELAPAAVLLDATLDGLDLLKTTRILARNPSTAATAVVLVAPPLADERQLRALRGLELFALLERPLTCEAIRETFAAALRFHADATALRRPIKPKPAATLVDGCNSLLQRTLLCPFHPYGVEVRHYALRAGKQYARTDDFDVPTYSQAAPGADFVDYTLAGLCVCPECYFATTEPRFLTDPNNTDDPEPYFAIDAATLARVTAEAGRRELLAHDALGGQPAASLFDFRRTRREAAVGYELAGMSGRAVYEAAPTRRAAELTRLGGYELRRAALCAALGDDPAATTARRYAAVAWLDKAFLTARGPSLYLAAYQLVALCVYLRDDSAALRYLGAMRELSGLNRRDLEEPVVLDRYLRRAQHLWADREHHRGPAPGASRAA